MTHKQKAEFLIRSTLLDRPRLLLLDPDYIEFDDQDQVAQSPTRFAKTELDGIRYGIKPISGYWFNIGRIYCIDVRATSGEIMKIRLKSIYRIRRKQLSEKYQAIANTLFSHYFHDLTRQYLALFHNDQPIELLGVHLNKHGVLFDEQVGWVSWNFLGTKRYWHYYTLYSEEAPDNYRAFVFLEDWNAGILRGLIESILKERSADRPLPPGRKNG